MASGNSDTTIDFAKSFDKLVPLIRNEWPEVEAEALDKTGGDFEQVVTLVAKKTEHTKTLVRKQLTELHSVSHEEPATAGELGRLRKMVDRLQAKSHEISDYVQQKMLADAKKKVADNPLTALLMALGLGLVLGFLLRGFGRGRRAGGDA
ncbi:MAG: hypothetical protein IT373_04630 [Polyangiaceae bacterium]|nr:hypothetical protein [Polyangiaceae bacterium]